MTQSLTLPISVTFSTALAALIITGTQIMCKLGEMCEELLYSLVYVNNIGTMQKRQNLTTHHVIPLPKHPLVV